MSNGSIWGMLQNWASQNGTKTLGDNLRSLGDELKGGNTFADDGQTAADIQREILNKLRDINDRL